jgi:hypothetical protein
VLVEGGRARRSLPELVEGLAPRTSQQFDEAKRVAFDAQHEIAELESV